MKPIPRMSVDLIEQIAKDEPELDITPQVNLEVIMYRSGRISMIKELLYRLEYFEKNGDPDKTEIKI